MFLFQSPSIFLLSPPPQHNTTTPQKDLRKQIHKHEQPPAIYTDNQQVAVFFNKVHNIVDHNLVNFLFFHYLCSLIEKM